MSKVEVYKDNAGEWRWRLKARNGRIIAVSGEGYKRKATCEDGFLCVRNTFLTTTIEAKVSSRRRRYHNVLTT